MRLRLLMLPRLNRALIRSNTAFNTSLITESLNIHLSRRNLGLVCSLGLRSSIILQLLLASGVMTSQTPLQWDYTQDLLLQ